MKLSFSIASWSTITKKIVSRTYEDCTYELETADLDELYVQATAWAKKATQDLRAYIEDVKLVDGDGLDRTTCKTHDEYYQWVAEEVACDPEYAGEEGLMQAYEDYNEEFEIIEFGNEELLVQKEI